jgi:hypothetical protein
MLDRVFGLNQEHKVTAAGEIRINCPFCVSKGKGPDTKFHLYVNLEKQVFNCYRCASAGSSFKLKNLLTVSSTPVKANFSDLRAKLTSMFKVKPVSEFDLDYISWPIDAPECPIGYKYMKDRGFTDEEMSKYHLRVGKNFKDAKTDETVRKWAGRILFPFFEHEQVVFMVGRSYTNKDPKYVNSAGSKAHVVYGLDRVTNGECILCEGIISAIAAERTTGMPAISCLGKGATRWQLSKIRTKTQKVFVALDNTSDVSEKDRKQLNRSLLRMGIEVWEVLPPEGKDPDDAGEEFLDCFKAARRVRL